MQRLKMWKMPHIYTFNNVSSLQINNALIFDGCLFIILVEERKNFVWTLLPITPKGNKFSLIDGSSVWKKASEKSINNLLKFRVEFIETWWG